MLSYTHGYSMDGIKNEKALIDILKVVFDEQDEEVIREQHENCINAWNEYKSNAKKKRNYDKKKNTEIKKIKEENKKLKEEKESLTLIMKGQDNVREECIKTYREQVEKLKEENEMWKKDAMVMRKGHNMIINLIKTINLDGATGTTLDMLNKLKELSYVEDSE